jgi:hypothetical protein|tara:strand:+ start:847 stop:1221 length:375 start_codon:yes stop_codon:yes gene_type:complete
MKNIITTCVFAVILGAGLMSCSVVEGVVGGSEGEATSFGGMVDTVWGLLKGFLPSLAAWEGFGSIFSSRKREHYGKMVMAVVPMNKNVEFGEAVKALGSGLGLAHSSEASAEAHAVSEEVKKKA